MRPPSKPDDPISWAVAPAEIPQSATTLTGDALDEWNRIGKYLLALHRVAKVDRQTLTAYCLMWGNFARLYREDFCEPWSRLYADGPKCFVIHPGIPPLLRYAQATLQMAGQFGMTARTRGLESDHGERKSAALKKLMGNQRKIATAKLEANIIRLQEFTSWEPGEVAPPEWIGNRATAEYYEIGQSLESLDLFTPLDRVPLTIGVCLFELLLRANEQMGELYTTYTKIVKTGPEDWEEEEYMREHPLHKVQYDVFTMLHRVWKDYGQTARYRRVFNGEKVAPKLRPIIFKGKFG